MIQEKEAQPVTLADTRVTADGIVLISDPNDENDVEGCSCIVEELRHDRFHTNQSQYDG